MLQNFKTFNLAVEFHHECEQLRVAPYLADQLLRASSSVALNIAEGSGKPTPKEQARFYGIALGSLRECEAAFLLARVNSPRLSDLARQLGACLFVLARRGREKAPD